MVNGKHAHEEEWNLYVIYCKDHKVASRYAAEQNWWLHCWVWHTDEYSPEVPLIYRRVDE